MKTRIYTEFTVHFSEQRNLPTQISSYKYSAEIKKKAFIVQESTCSTCPSGVVLSSLSSVEPEQPFFTLFGLSFRE